ncbi:MAG: BlaI/MecI/CopY family transcriptional regulator [Lachnospiraceae bacterium]|nr:BlaI/MecI/CopY family transcriptional regulator [Lachnospiraceae bacterium]
MTTVVEYRNKNRMKVIYEKSPEFELEIMLRISNADKLICCFELEGEQKEINWATTILTLLSRLEKKGFIHSKKQGKVKCYTPVVNVDEYAARESKGILDRFLASL